MSALTVRAYNVLLVTRFWSAFRPGPGRGRETIRHILIDVGNVLHGDGGRDESLSRSCVTFAVDCAGGPVDLYVMTHEHLDHVQACLRVEPSDTRRPSSRG